MKNRPSKMYLMPKVQKTAMGTGRQATMIDYL